MKLSLTFHAPRSTYLPKEIQLSLPVFTRRGVGDFEGEKAPPSQPNPLCEPKSADAHWVEQLREAPRANFGLRRDQGSPDDTQRAQVAESLWGKVKSKTAESKLPCVTTVVALGKGLPPTLRAQADSHRPHLLRQRVPAALKAEAKPGRATGSVWVAGSLLYRLAEGGLVGHLPWVSKACSSGRRSLYSALSAFVQDTTFGVPSKLLVTDRAAHSLLTGSG